MNGLFDLAVKSTVILGAAWLASAVWRRRAAAERHLLWCAAVVSLAALPVLSLVLPALRVPVTAIAAGPVYRFSAGGDIDLADGAGAHGAAGGASRPFARHARAWNWRSLVAPLWLAGAAIALARLLFGLAILARWRRGARAVCSAAWNQALEDAARQLGVGRRVRLLETPRAAVPMTGGVLRPAIYLPPAARGWDADRRRAVLLHELAHVRRRDALTGFACRLALCGYWWHPLAWVAAGALLRERERASDDLVLAAGERPSDYAGHLLDLAAAFHAPRGAAAAAVCVARPSQLEQRLNAILDPRTPRAGALRPAFAALAAFLLVVPLAAMRPQAIADLPASAADVDAVVRASQAQRDHATLERLAAELAKRHRYPEAETLAAAALEVRAGRYGSASPEYAAGLVLQGRVLRSEGKWKEAEEAYTRALALEERAGAAEPATLAFLALAAHTEKDAERSLALYQRALGLNPDAAERGRLLTGLALVESGQGRDRDAESHYRDALQLLDGESPDAASASELLASLLARANRADEATPLEARARRIRDAEVGRSGERLPAAIAALKVGPGVTAPRLLMKVEPQYSELARAARYQGTVVLTIEIGADGAVHGIRLLRGLGLGLDEQAADAVSRWQFQPGTRDGAPVAVRATVEVNFRLR